MKASEKESYEAIHRQLADKLQEAYREDAGEKASPDIDLTFLKEDTAAGKKRKKVYMRTAGIAAAVLIVLLGANMLLLSYDKADTYGDKGVLHRLYSSVVGLFTDEDASEANDVEESFAIDDDADMAMAKRFFPDMYIPEYIPDGYTLDKLTVDRYHSGDVVCSGKYTDDNGATLEITQISASGDDFEYMSQGEGELIELADRSMYLTWDEVFEEYSLTVYTEVCSIDIYMEGNSDKTVLTDIGRGLKR